MSFTALVKWTRYGEKKGEISCSGYSLFRRNEGIKLKIQATTQNLLLRHYRIGWQNLHLKKNVRVNHVYRSQNKEWKPILAINGCLRTGEDFLTLSRKY